MKPVLSYVLLPSLLAIGLIVGWAGCSFQSDDFNVATVVNAMDEPLVFWAAGHSHPLDPIPRIPMEKVTPNVNEQKPILVEAGASATLSNADLDGNYNSDKPLQLFFYEVRGDTAYFADYRKLSYDDLKRQDFRIEISEFPKY